MSVVINAENISKLYRLGILSSRTIAQDVNRFIARVRGKEDPYMKVGEINNREKKRKIQQLEMERREQIVKVEQRYERSRHNDVVFDRDHDRKW